MDRQRLKMGEAARRAGGVLLCAVLVLMCVFAGCGEPQETTGDVVDVPQVPSADCPTGTLKCPCSAGGGCALGPDGEVLQCSSGVCLNPVCPRGSLGCECQGVLCREGVCADGLCALEDCDEGSQNCACDQGSCGLGLFCKEGKVCVEGQGYEGGACFENDTCHKGYRCEQLQGVCVFCELGTQGCQCTDAGTCTDGLQCIAGRCLTSYDLPPENPKCYAPCDSDLQVGTDVRVCDEDGLLDGCIGERSCVEGSCLLPGERKPTCENDGACPFFQTCLEGGCYSNCEVSSDCAPGLGCHHRVCRAPCMVSTGGVGCPDEMDCDSRDGETGFCVPLIEEAGEVVRESVVPTFQVLDSGAFSLTNNRTEVVIQIVPESGEEVETQDQVLTIRPRGHNLFFEDGTAESKELLESEDATCSGFDCPLWWIELSSNTTLTPLEGGAYQMTLSGDCRPGDDIDACPRLTLSAADRSPGVRYDGTIEVSGPGGRHEIKVGYTQELSGRWVGQMHYFTSFTETGVQAWLDRSDRTDATGLENAFLQRWVALRKGNLDGGWPEWQAIVTATRTGSWSQPRVEELCSQAFGGSTTTVCYPFTNREGVRAYVQGSSSGLETDSVGRDTIPGTTTELPIAVHIKAARRSENEPFTYTGRVDSATALHYPGNPAFSIAFPSNPELPGSCLTPDPVDGDESIAQCLVDVGSLDLEVMMGARTRRMRTTRRGPSA